MCEVMVPGRAKRRSGRLKSDPADAEVTVRQTLARANSSKPKRQFGWTEDLGRLAIVRDRFVQVASAMANAAEP